MASANRRIQNGITKSIVPSLRLRPLPPLPHSVTSNTNNITMKQSKYIMRHIHEAIVKKYQQSIYKLVDDFERELQLKDETIVGLHAEIARLRRNASSTWHPTKMVEFEIAEDADDQSASDPADMEENFPLYDDENETLDFIGVPNTMNEDNVIAAAAEDKSIETVYDDAYSDTDDRLIDEEEEEDEEEAIANCIENEQRTTKLLSIKIQPNKTEVIHRCEQCNKVVSTRRTLMKHIRIVHSTQKPYSCEYCTRSFPQKDGLKRHIRIHTGEKPFACPLCQKCFNQSGNLRIHEKSCKKLMTI